MKPVTIEAIEWDGSNTDEIENFCGEKCNIIHDPGITLKGNFIALVIYTVDGKLYASVGDYIIKGVNGETYTCKPDVFEKYCNIVGDDSTAKVE